MPQDVFQTLSDYIQNAQAQKFIDMEEKANKDLLIDQFVRKDGSFYLEFDRRYLQERGEESVELDALCDEYVELSELQQTGTLTRYLRIVKFDAIRSSLDAMQVFINYDKWRSERFLQNHLSGYTIWFSSSPHIDSEQAKNVSNDTKKLMFHTHGSWGSFSQELRS